MPGRMAVPMGQVRGVNLGCTPTFRALVDVYKRLHLVTPARAGGHGGGGRPVSVD